jgi:hypothetical protein
MKVLSKVKDYTRCINMIDDELCKTYPNRSGLGEKVLKNMMIYLCNELIETLESGDNYWQVIESCDDLLLRYIKIRKENKDLDDNELKVALKINNEVLVDGIGEALVEKINKALGDI